MDKQKRGGNPSVSKDLNMQVNSSSFFRIHWRVWRLTGLAYEQMHWKKFYIGYNIVCHLLFTVAYPLHLGISVFRNDNLTDDMRNLTYFATCCASSLKFAIYAYNFDKVREMEQLLELLDARIQSQAELQVYGQLRVQLKRIVNGIMGICVICTVTAELSFLCQSKRALEYPAWLPFDWRHSTLLYYLANIYQCLGSLYLIMENFANDCFPVVLLCLISGHIQMLYLRFEQVGLAKEECELEACITDHKHLLQLFETLQSFISLPMLIQIAVSALNLCLSIASVLFFVTEPWARMYFFFYTLAMPLQIFPTCYYGTINELWFGKLHYAAFSCNWLPQERSFKQKLMLFVERSLKRNTAMAGGMLRIHVDTFFSALKFAYSLFTIILRMRK